MSGNIELFNHGDAENLGFEGSALISHELFRLEPRVELTGIAFKTGIKLGLLTATGFSKIWKPLN